MTGRADRLWGYGLLVIATIVALAPVDGVLILSLGESGRVGAQIDIANANNWGNFAEVWSKGGFSSSMMTSAVITITVVLVSVCLSVPAGYGFALMSFKGRSWIFYLFVLGILIPIEAMIIPLYFDLRSVNLANSYLGVILPEIGFSVAFGVFWMRAYFIQSARSLVEAAWLDGANSWQTLTRILVPLARPQMLTLSVLFFVWNWNDFLLPLIMLSGSDLQTAPMSLVFFVGQRSTDYAYLAAAAIITITPVIIVFVALQKSFTRGLLAGAVKE